MSTTRPRAPLASIPNATNSPHRSLTQSIGKRTRQQGPVLQENEPPQKKQLIEKNTREDGPATPRRRVPPPTAEGRVFERASTNVKPTDFHRKLIAKKKEAEIPTVDTADSTIRAWQKHYRKVFPSFVFYFDSIPGDIRVRFSKQIGNFGAQEEKFFSKAVTHIVTTRPIPAESPTSETSATSGSQSTNDADDQPRTINPSLLDKNSALQAASFPAKAQMGASIQRERAVPMDVLSRGRQMGMKIWALEKLQRILVSMMEYDASGGHNGRANIATAATTRLRDEDLSQVLRNEKLNGPLDRDLATSTKELALFKGPFIYIHDMDAKTRPIMVREYPKVARRQDGAWPQFRSAPAGKCPFVDDPAPKKDSEKEKERERALAAQQARELQQAPQTRSVAADQEIQMNPPRRSPRKILREVHNVPVPAPGFRDIVPKAPTFEAPKALPQMSFGARQDPTGDFIKPQYMHFAKEPAASGIQRSNITSAIRSQMISSTAAAPGAKAGTSKEVNELKRKVLERSNTGSLSVGSIPSSHRMTDIAGALKNARAPPPQRAAKSKAQEKLGGIVEEANMSDDELAAERAIHAPVKKKRAARKDPKPGYCENCRDKYEDFDDHIMSRKHRKFALTQANWTELDELLRKLQEDP
ncbi:hypothetical protein GJ744_005086 [Endocarpon pusillum]|uniref:DBF4-type domain-containing protein n=1 Tax=Endocarpon pusillum TaxID=364733 RepID=A0A8H7APL2_9EURO|nr:hypothetical protein GJ744_005086 [Endocarpon pusillum]